MKPIIYLDLDGTLADFEKKAIELFGDQWKQEVEAAGWGQFTKYPNIYEILEPMPDALELYEGCCEIIDDINHVQILTALPRRAEFVDAAKHKIEWARKYIHRDIRVNFGPHAQDKQYHIRSDRDVLIDDMERNIIQWRESGGVGVVHVSAKQSLEELYDYWWA